MGFFDDLVVPGEPVPESGPTLELGPPGPDFPGEDRPPEDWYLPTVLPGRTEVGAGPHTRVMLTGMSVWPDAVTLHLVAFRRRASTGGWYPRDPERDADGLHVGLLLADGRRVTTLDGDPWPVMHGGRRRTYTLTGQGGARSAHREELDLLLSALPPLGPLTLVVEWPAQGVPETSTALDAHALRAAAHDALAIWPDLAPPPGTVPDAVHGAENGTENRTENRTEDGESVGEDLWEDAGEWCDAVEWQAAEDVAPTGPMSAGTARIVGPAGDFLAAAVARADEQRRALLLRRREGGPTDPHRYDPRPDWQGIGRDDWADLALVRARLDGGADPDGSDGPGGPGSSQGSVGSGSSEGSGGSADPGASGCTAAGPSTVDGRRTPLHSAAGCGAPAEVLTELLRRGARPDPPDEEGVTPLWEAVRHGGPEQCEVLLAAGADAWRPCVDGWTPGRLALARPELAPLFERLPGAVPLTGEERAAQEEANRLIDVFRAVEDTEGIGVAFVAGIDEEELIRRLGARPADCPVLDLDREPGPFGTGPGGFDPDDFEESLAWVGLTGVPGGVVVNQPMGYTPEDERFLTRVSAGTAAYGVFFNAKGGTLGTLARDGVEVKHEEIGLSPFAGAPPEFYRFRFWDRSAESLCGATELAYACAQAGMALTDASPLLEPPRRWVRVPYTP
ncbi:ankyrin repeat domain-containing protein [Streptomyces cacaoi]|uniref:ankyrin repeat domain-containing protein n=1 Tax=Streptomyces cacaoi TaxID=1898 RepID=UPI0011F38A7F|nr:ankyrin repeat domain-containing protein [Streptomyces cacaoi]